MNDTLRTFFSRPAGIVGLALLGIVCIVGAVAPILYPDGPWVLSGMPFARPGETGMMLGADTLGRDIAAGIAHGARVSLLIGIASTLAALCIGVTLGALA
eukprot:GHVR01070807.1.p2 GENE.GHVR01070807.1~~GHVR01070807.1.p2  ORF type:complete len:100 (-),score=25.83 GHVR01070807.1:8-307(-)